MKKKKILAVLLAALMLLTLLSGCAGEETPVTSAQTTGRYVEETVDLPRQSRYAKDMVMLTDGRLRVAVQEENGDVLLATLAADGNSWEQTGGLPERVMTSGTLESLALAPDGRVFCATIEGSQAPYTPHLWVISAEGEARELPVTYPEVDPEMGFFLPGCDFTEDGRLLAQIYVWEVREIDLETGAMGENLCTLTDLVTRIGCAGEKGYVLDGDNGWLLGDDGMEALPEVLKTQIAGALVEDANMTPRINFWENSEGYLFFTTGSGIYSYVSGGSVTEELVSAARTSLGDPTFRPVALTGRENGEFYVLGNQQQAPMLCRYYYDETMPTVSDTQLRIYSLYEDEGLRQIIARFQKENPNITVDLEIGITGEDAVTEADAIRTLNTKILAGDGPDLLRLDGFHVENYIEKGLLMDVRDLLQDGDALLEQVTTCYESEGKICAVPTTFSLPVLYGQERIVSQVQDLNSLVAAARQLREENPDRDRIVNAMIPIMMGDYFYDGCSAAWVREDGTLDEEKLTEYYAAMKELYGLNREYPEEYQQMLEARAAEYVPGDYTGLGGASYIFENISCLPSGTLGGMEAWSYALAGESEYLGEGYATVPLNGQAEHIFLPGRILGILTSARYPEAARTFLLFALSQEAQELTGDFPVNWESFAKQIREDRVSEVSFGSSDEEGNELSYNAQWPNRQQRQTLQNWVEALTTPALTDRTIRKTVLSQVGECCKGKITPEEAARTAVQELNLYLAE